MFRTNPNYVFVIASYNNEANVDMNISSVAKQLYKNWRIIYINDASTDETSDNLQKVIQKYKISDKITIIENEKKKLINHTGSVEDNFLIAIATYDNPKQNIIG